MDILKQVATVITAFATTGIAILTYFYVRFTKNLIEETKKGNLLSHRPILVLSKFNLISGINANSKISCSLAIKNIGKGGALEIFVLKKKDNEWWLPVNSLFKNKKEMEIVREIPGISPGENYIIRELKFIENSANTILNSMQKSKIKSLSTEIGNEIKDKNLEDIKDILVVVYKDLFGNKFATLYSFDDNDNNNRNYSFVSYISL